MMFRELGMNDPAYITNERHYHTEGTGKKTSIQAATLGNRI